MVMTMNNSYFIKQTPKPKNTALFLAFALLFFCGGCAIYILSTKNAGIYSPLYLLPLCFGLISFFVFLLAGDQILRNMVSLLLVGGYFVKMVLTPFVFAWGDYESFLGASVTKAGIDRAILLMCAETFLVLCMVCHHGRRAEQMTVTEINFPQYNTKVFNAIVGLLFIFLIVAYATVPAISEIYYFLPLADFHELAKIRWDDETIVDRESFQRYIYSLFGYLWPVFRTIMPALMISHFYKKYGLQTKGMILSFACLMLPATLLGGDNIAPFIGVLIGVIVIYKLYKEKARKLLFFISILATVLLWFIVESKMELLTTWKGATGVSVFAQMLHNYFPGFDNLAVVFEMSKENKLSTLFYDVYYTIPFKETLFGFKGEYIQDLFLQYTGTDGQIVPFVGQLAYYLGPLSVVVTGLIVQLAFKAEQKSKRSDNFWEYFIFMYLSVYTAISLSIYSVSIYLRGLVNVVLPAYIIIKFVGRKRSKGNSKGHFTFS